MRPTLSHPRHSRSTPPILSLALAAAGIWIAACASAGAPGTDERTATPPGADAESVPPPVDLDARAPHRPAIPLSGPLALSTHGDDGERIDPVESLHGLLTTGDVELAWDSVTGYLPALLSALDVPISSQGFVFSRTSLQTDRIAPWTPRAIYFNDDVYVGFVQDSPMLEIASIDPDAGSVFYVMLQSQEEGPVIQRQGTTCLMCHESRSVTQGVPGVMVRSVLTDRFGYQVTTLHEGPNTDRTPPAERLAGWYVTGTHAPGAHAGNVHAPELAHEIGDALRYLDGFDMNGDGNVTSLRDRFDTSYYLSEHSDLVALLVLSHQTRVHNLIAKAHFDAREALRQQEAVVVTTGRELPESGLLPNTEVTIDGAVDLLVREMMFAREAPIGGPIRGTSGFADEFTARGPRDPQGRSLRDFDLETRLFRYPLSFLVYTEAFDALPELVKGRVYRRIDTILRGEDDSGLFDAVAPDLLAATREILVATKPDFAEMAGR